MRIGTRLFLTVGGLILLFSVVLSAIPITMTGSALERATVERLQAQGDSLAQTLRDGLHRTTADLEVITAHKSIENYFTLRAFEELEGMEEEINSLEAFLARLATAKPEYARLQITAGGRPVLQLSDGARTQVYDDFPTERFSAALRADDEAALHEVVYDGELALLSAAPLRSEGRIEGLLWAYQPIRSTLDAALADMAGKGLAAAVRGPEGQLVAHTAADDTAFAGALAAGDAAGWIVRLAEVPELGWVIGVGLAEAEGFAVVRHITLTVIAASVIGLVLVIGILALLVSRIITRRIGGVAAEMRQIAQGEGDLTVRLDTGGKDEIAELAAAFNEFVGKIHAAVGSVAQTTPRVAEAARRLAQLTADTSGHIGRQSLGIDQVATAMTEMTATIHEVANNASRAAQSTQQADSLAAQSRDLVQRTIGTISELAQDVEKAAQVVQRLDSSSSEVGGVLDVIRGIAEQTNLLALNAAIEAARAGEQGRGFAVVADEVRTLAQRTQSSTYEIQEMVERVQSGAAEAVSVLETERGEASSSVEQSDQTGAALDEITRAVGAISDMNTQIASSAEEQSAVAEDINRNIAGINEVAGQVADAATDMARSANDLAALSAQLEDVVKLFKTS